MEQVYKQHTGLLSPWVDGMRARKAAASIPPGAKVLDVGCGSALLIAHLAPECQYTGIDVDARVIEENKKRFPSMDRYAKEFTHDSQRA